MRPVRLRFDPERGPGLVAVAFSLGCHVVAGLAVAVLAQTPERTAPRERTLSVRFVPGSAAAVRAQRAAAAVRPRRERDTPRREAPPLPRPEAPAPVAATEAPTPPPEPRAAGPRTDRKAETPPKQPPPTPAKAATPPATADPGETAPPGPVGGPPGPGLTAHVGDEDSPGDEYLSRLVARVSASWVKPRTGLPARKAVVLFEMTRTGVVRSAVIELSSGSALYDRAALRAVQVASPLPPLPPAFATPVLKVHFEFIP